MARTVFHGVTALTAVWAVVITAQSLAATRDQLQLKVQTQTAERLDRAVDLLSNEGEEHLSRRLGAIHSLERLMYDSPEAAETAIDLLAAFVRTHAVPPANASGEQVPVGRDVQAALQVLGVGWTGIRTGQILDLSGAYLVGANLAQASLSRVDLSDANLGHAYLAGASMIGANLTRADLNGAHLNGAKLNDATLIETNLTNTDLAPWVPQHVGPYVDLNHVSVVRTDLSGANLVGATLADAMLLGVDFSNAHLEGTDLGGSYLFLANMSGTRLQGADLSNVGLLTVELTWADLSIIASLSGNEVLAPDNRLTAASLYDAWTAGVDLAGAGLVGIEGLTGEWFADATISDATRLPDAAPGPNPGPLLRRG